VILPALVPVEARPLADDLDHRIDRLTSDDDEPGAAGSRRLVG